MNFLFFWTCMPKPRHVPPPLRKRGERATGTSYFSCRQLCPLSRPYLGFLHFWALGPDSFHVAIRTRTIEIKNNHRHDTRLVDLDPESSTYMAPSMEFTVHFQLYHRSLLQNAYARASNGDTNVSKQNS